MGRRAACVVGLDRAGMRRIIESVCMYELCVGCGQSEGVCLLEKKMSFTSLLVVLGGLSLHIAHRC